MEEKKLNVDADRAEDKKQDAAEVSAAELTDAVDAPAAEAAVPKKKRRIDREAVLRFMKRKGIEISWKRYAIDAMSAMALGLFASLLIATIFKAVGMVPWLGFCAFIGDQGGAVAGCAMGVAIAFSLKAPPLVLYSSALVGYIANQMGGAGGPLAVFLFSIIAIECGKAVYKETKIDVLVTPFVTVLVGGGLSFALAPYIGHAVWYFAKFIGWATLQQPFVMGLLVAVAVGMALTLPISSAAICASLQLTGYLNHAAWMADVEAGLRTAEEYAYAASDAEGLALAAGAAVVGCCAQMVGFAVMSFKENGWGGLVSQGLGTSMLQMPNIIKNPRIWIPPTVAAAVTGPLATCLFRLRMYGAAINSGMGTCGFLGPIGIILGWYDGQCPMTPGPMDWIGLVLLCFILPALVSWLLGVLLRRIGWIKENDLKLP